MLPGPYKQVALAPDEMNLLKIIYNKRFFFITAAYIAILSLSSRYSPFGGLLYNSLNNTDPEQYQYMHTTKKDLGISPFQMILFSALYIEGPIIASFFIFFFTRVYPFRRDIKSGVKEVVPYTIVRKEFFPLTDQYYVALDDPDYMHHEIDEATYNKVNEGDYMYLNRAIHSKYVFEINGRFTIL